MRKTRPFLRGFTMIELLIVVAILGISMIIVYLSVVRYVQQSRDAVRKTHLEKYRVALEEYFADYGKYPPPTAFEDCDGPALAPYIPKVYCDPTSGEPYRYQTDVRQKSYSLFAKLMIPSDPVIASRGCQNGCGPDDDSNGAGDYNYGLSSEQATVGTGTDNTQVAATCGSGSQKYCSPGVCGNCCPGQSYRCNSTGTGCYADSRCRSL
jgi:prepilin-type N-terminal cleavage/methylation domain-containing protein